MVFPRAGKSFPEVAFELNLAENQAPADTKNASPPPAFWEGMWWHLLARTCSGFWLQNSAFQQLHASQILYSEDHISVTGAGSVS
jgi:hypothetical protein